MSVARAARPCSYLVAALIPTLDSRRLRLALALACAAAFAGCGGATARRPDRDAQARAALVHAGREVMAFGRAHGTFDVGGVAGLHRLDPSAAIVNFVDGRRTSFFLAVTPPATRTIWRYDYDHNSVGRAQCHVGPGRKCRGMRRW